MFVGGERGISKGEKGRRERIEEEEGMGDNGGVLPGWLESLVEETFFVGCETHESRRKNEKNIFCLQCCTSICPHCASSHHPHPMIQVRRYIYNEVVRLDDLEKLIDCSFVQPYTINSAKVVFLKPRSQARPSKGSGNICLTCDRILQDTFHFCSLSCKVDHVVSQGEEMISSILFRSDECDFAISHFESLRMDNSDVLLVDSLLEDAMPSDSGRSQAKVTKRKNGGGFFPQIVLSLGSRRKGAPNRSPLS